jgi:hypothetical protein
LVRVAPKKSLRKQLASVRSAPPKFARSRTEVAQIAFVRLAFTSFDC